MREQGLELNQVFQLMVAALLGAVLLNLLGVSVVHAMNTNTGFPRISAFLTQLHGTVTGPFGGVIFGVGVMKSAQGIWRQGGIEGMGDGGLRTAGAGLFIGGGPWLAGQLGVAGALV